jgi:hypothetical protein
MSEKTWTHKDSQRASLPVGPWDIEPDKVQWIDRETDLDCMAVRNAMGAWCGYVGVPPGHRFYGVDYNDVPVWVHGGLTFGSYCQEDPRGEAYGVCHTPEPGRPANVYWLGFDCAHSFDLIPTMLDYGLETERKWPYRDLNFVREQCTSLAAQLEGGDDGDDS